MLRVLCTGVKSFGHTYMTLAPSALCMYLEQAGVYSIRVSFLYREMRMLFAHIRRQVERRYRVDDHHKELPWQSVSAFCFLRFIVPAILHPHLFGLWAGKLPLLSLLHSRSSK